MTASSKRLRKLENDANASLDDIYRERQRNSQLRSKLSIRGLGRPQTNFATGFDNVVMQVDTNFRFNPEEALRPVKLCFADRFLFAARPSVPKRPVDPDAPPVDVGDNGELLSWEYRVTQLAAREWSVDEINVQDLFPIAEADGVFAAPSMVLFSQNDGVSRQFPPASHWGISRYSGRKPYFVLGSVGSARAESQILQVYETTQLTNENRTPASHYSSYEAGVTALAISSQSTLVAFAVRERAVHRVFVADLTRFDRSLTLVSEYFHKNPWLVNDSNQPGMPGITSLAFSNDNKYLVGHGQYDENLWRFTTWSLEGEKDGSIKGKVEWELDNKERPFLNDLNSRPIRFIQVPTQAVSAKDKSTSANPLIVENDSGYAILDLSARKVVGEIAYLQMQRGLPQRALSEDGRWLIMGDDRGNVYVWNTLTRQRYSVAHSREDLTDKTPVASKTISNKKPQDKPAHTGPVMGVALSGSLRNAEFPEFAATVGEENRLIVWDLIPVLAQSTAPAPPPSKKSANKK